MPKWEKVSAGVVNVDQLQATINVADGVLSPLTTSLELITSVLDLLATFVFSLPPPLQSIIEAAVNTIEQMLRDLLQNNASLCVHANMNWKSDWKYRRKKGDPARIVDFVNDNALPFGGTGTTGWLLDVASSAHDDTNPFRPYSDSDTGVAGIIVIKGVPSGGDLTVLKKIFDMFTDFSAFSTWLDVEQRLLQGVSDDFRNLLRLGPSAFDKKTEKIHRPFFERMGEAAIGTLIASGTAGENTANSASFTDVSEPTPFDGVAVGDVLKLAGESPFYTVNALTVDPQVILVDPPIRRSHLTNGAVTEVFWSIYRGGLIAALDALPTAGSEFEPLLPRPGNLPVWLSVPIASMVPVVGSIIDKTEDLATALRAGIAAQAALYKLIALLQEKIALIEKAIEEVNELLILGLSILEFFDDTYIITIRNDEGGVARFVNDAISAEDIPYFGHNGVVVGFVALVTMDGPANHLESFFDLIGLEWSQFSADLTAADEARQDTWNGYFPP